MMYKKPIRHGDVDIIPVDEIPKDAKLEKNNLVMHGENGHSHKLVNGQLLVLNGQKFIQSSQNTFLEHEEHKKTSIPEGFFKVLQETEFDPFKELLVRVKD